MTDSYGDGWNGNVMTLTTGSGYSWEFELENGAEGLMHLLLGPNRLWYLLWMYGSICR